MNITSRILMFAAIVLLATNVLFSQTTYYSFATGDWEDATSWTLTSDGSSGVAATAPGGTDNVVIRSGHTITIDNTNDNGNQTTANALGLANVGTFAGSGNNAFYHEGDIIVSNGGTLTSTVRMMTADVFSVENGGTFSTGGNDDLIILGSLNIASTASFSVGDDFILSGNSRTVIDNTTTAGDDLYIDHTDATLCGDGVVNTGNGGGNPTVQYLNSATTAQVCASFSITCTSNCGGFSSGPPSGGFITGNTGPGGVGDASNNQLWLKADDLSLTDGAAVTSWADASGNSLTASSSGVSTEEPTFNTNDVNGFPSISFDGGDFLNLGNVAALNLTPGTDSWSFFIVYHVTGATPQGTFFSKATATGSTRQYQYMIDDNAGTSRFTASIGGNFTVGNVVSTNAWFVSSSINDATTKDSWSNESSNFSAGVGTGSVPTADVLIGARRGSGPTTGTGFHVTGNIAEIAMFDAELNDAQRIIATNYFAAKYGVTLTANDIYDMDDGGNGDFDYEVAGIGQAADGSNHTDARGSGIVRMWDPSDLGNSEFLMWGHDNVGITLTNSIDVDGIIIEERLARVWRVSETGDVGTVSISLDFSTVGSPLGSNLRLLIDRDGDGFSDNDITPIEGSVSNDVATFSNINLQDGDRITIGNMDATIPLPVELITFDVSAGSNTVNLSWATASETNNDFFSIERSSNGKDWNTIIKEKGAGNSNHRLSYHVKDQHPLVGLSFYRLKQTDFDGQFTYSDIKAIEFSGLIGTLYASPNPSKDEFVINVNVKSLNQVNIYDNQGRVVDAVLSRNDSQINVDLSGHRNGIYFLQISDATNSTEVIKLIKD